MPNNKTVLDLNKVQHGTFYWINQYGDMRIATPSAPTVRGAVVTNLEYAAHHPSYPGERLYERALRLDLLDTWVPVVSFQLTANHSIQFTGNKAVEMWSLFRKKIIGESKKQRRKK